MSKPKQDKKKDEEEEILEEKNKRNVTKFVEAKYRKTMTLPILPIKFFFSHYITFYY